MLWCDFPRARSRCPLSAGLQVRRRLDMNSAADRDAARRRPARLKKQNKQCSDVDSPRCWGGQRRSALVTFEEKEMIASCVFSLRCAPKYQKKNPRKNQ